MHVSSTYRPQNQFLSQGNLSATASYTFSAKEKDSETNLSYFGARYYSSDLSIWLSVDPMAAKYPSLSPYVYCANNPIKLVDPNGEEVYIIGNQYIEAFYSLQKSTSLKLSINDEGKILAEGKAQNRNDEKLLKAINSSKVKVVIYADNSNDENPYGGAYMGSSYSKESGKVESCNHINMELLSKLETDSEAPSGSGILHEITEGYKAGIIALRKKKDVMPAIKKWTTWTETTTQEHVEWISPSTRIIKTKTQTETHQGYLPIFPSDYKIYEKAHKWATPAPNPKKISSN
jgi:RHS repeat-associated protein